MFDANEVLDALKPEDAEQATWTIDSMEKADWALGKIAAARQKMQQNADYVQSQVEKLQIWLEKMNKEQQNSIDFFELKLAPYLESEIAGSKKKSVTLPNGVVGYRKKTNTIKNDAEIFDFVKNNYSEYIKTEEKVDLASFKKACSVVDGKLITEDGEVVPGYTVEESQVLYTK